MTRHLCAALLLLASFIASSQCPRIYDYLGALSYTPQFINCNGNAYTVNFQSDVNFGTYTVSWGDGSPNHTAAVYLANSIVSHTYSAATNSYVLTFSTGTCVLTGTVVNEQPALASIAVPSGVGSTLCAPKTLTFTNATTFTSTTTTYTWHFGDGSPPEVHTYTNSGQDVTHLYQKGTVNCVTQVTLMAKNYCNFTPSSNSFGPLQVYDIDDAGITPDRLIRCWPDNQFTFTNSTQRNCLPQGNTGQRYELWNFGNHWSMGTDSVIGWDPWPPSMPRSVSYPSIGSYTVTLADSNVCGIDVQVINVNIVNAPVAALQVPTVIVCQNTQATFTNSSSPGYQYRWNFGDGGGFVTLTGGTRTYTYTTPGTYTVRLVAQIPGAGGACSDTASGVVNVMPSPTPSFAVSPSTACGSLAATFTDLSTGAVAWNWSFGNGATSTLQTPPAQDYTLPASYVATLMATSGSGCVRSSTAALLVRNKPLPSFIQANACEGSPLNFTNTSTAGGSDPIGSYTWAFGQGNSTSTATNPSFTYSLAGTYTVQLKAATAFCEDSTALPITIFVKPTASFVITPTVGCPPFTANFGNQSQNAGSFLWRFGPSPTATANTTGATFIYTNSTSGFLNYTVTLLAFSPAGCADSTTRPVTVRPKPVAQYTTSNITGCSPLVTTFSSTGQGASTYSWSFGDGTSATTPGPTHSYSNTTLFTQTLVATLLVTNSVGCTDTATGLITVYPEALTAFTMVPTTGCSPLLVNFPSVPGVATYSWSHGDGTPDFTTHTQHNYTFVNSTLADIIFTITLWATTSNSCSGSGTGTVAAFHNPTANFTFAPAGGCTPLPVTFHNQSSGGISAINWTFGNGQTSNNTIAASIFTNSTGGAEQNYSAKLVVSTINGCRDSITRNLVVYAQPRAHFTPDTPACAPKIISFENSSAGAASFKWSFGDGTSSSADTVQHLYVNSTGQRQTFPAKLVATSLNMCSDSLTVPVNIYPKPEYVIAATPEQGCSPLSVFFPEIVGVAQYEWKYDNNISFGSSGDLLNTFENKTNTTKVFTVQLVARNVHTCSDTSTKLITVFPLPTAKFSAKPLSVFIPNEPVNFSNESSNLAINYAWDFGDGEKSTEKHPVHLYTAPGEYKVTLIASSIHGCRDTFELGEFVTALEETSIQMPNAFTPNPSGSPGTRFDPRDTSNDIFHPNVKGAERYTFSIYSRWGELLFETRDPEEGWDGYYKGKLCTQDIYVWKVTATFIDGKTYNKTGDVLLLR